MKLEDLREAIAEEVGYAEEQNGSEMQRSYGCSDDGLIKMCHELMSKDNADL